MIYLDHAATTPLRKEAFNVMLPYFAEHAANANALYAEGRKARSAIDQARGQIADAIHAKSSEIYFTGGGAHWKEKTTSSQRKLNIMPFSMLVRRWNHWAMTLPMCQSISGGVFLHRILKKPFDRKRVWFL